MQDIANELRVALFSEHDRLVVATALGYGLAVTRALEREPGAPPAPTDEADRMRAMIETMVPHDAELEKIIRATSWRVGHLVGQWPRGASS